MGWLCGFLGVGVIGGVMFVYRAVKLNHRVVSLCSVLRILLGSRLLLGIGWCRAFGVDSGGCKKGSKRRFD